MPAGNEGQTVLLVDDDPDFISQLTGILVEAGYVVLSSRDGAAAVRLIDRHHLSIQLAIIDLLLPTINGFELIGMITRRQQRPKIIGVSKTKRSILDGALVVGADAVVQKPPEGRILDLHEWLMAVYRQIGMALPRDTGNRPDR